MAHLPQIPVQPESNDVNRRRCPHPGAATLKNLSESKPFGMKFLRFLRARGLSNVQLVVSGRLSGLAAAIRSVSIGSAWLRCRVHLVCHVCSAIERASRELVTETSRTVFAQTTGEDVRTRLNVVANGIERQFPQIKRLFLEAATDITAFAD
jgi:transposase-like protein